MEQLVTVSDNKSIVALFPRLIQAGAEQLMLLMSLSLGMLGLSHNPTGQVHSYCVFVEDVRWQICV